jgi:hypothetical protein
MAKISPQLEKLLKEYGEDGTAVWDCHGTWVAYHAAVERMAAKADIVFSPPNMIVNDGMNGTVVVLVTGRMGDNEDYREEWSFGEVSPKNNKNAYPYAMAEKRAKDRVALKLLGLSGMVYSEEEADDFKDSKPEKSQTSAQMKRDGFWEELEREIDECQTLVALEGRKAYWRQKAIDDRWSPAWKAAAKDRFEGAEKRIMNDMEAEESA